MLEGAISAVVLLILVIPGFVFIYSYYQHEGEKIAVSPYSQVVVKSVIVNFVLYFSYFHLNIPLYFLIDCLFFLCFGVENFFRISTENVNFILGAIAGHIDGEITNKINRNHLEVVLWHFLGICIFSRILASLIKLGVRRLDLDWESGEYKKLNYFVPLFRYESRWFYMLEMRNKVAEKKYNIVLFKIIKVIRTKFSIPEDESNRNICEKLKEILDEGYRAELTKDLNQKTSKNKNIEELVSASAKIIDLIGNANNNTKFDANDFTTVHVDILCKSHVDNSSGDTLYQGTVYSYKQKNSLTELAEITLQSASKRSIKKTKQKFENIECDLLVIPGDQIRNINIRYENYLEKFFEQYYI